MMEIEKKLKKLGQSQLLNFYNELDNDKKEKLLSEIQNIDISNINKLYKNSYIDNKYDLKYVSSLKCILKEEIKNDLNYINIGKHFIKCGSYAVVIMAGGDGSRLGLNMPKGCLELNINNKNISLFETYINQLKKVYDELGVYVDLYLMTSFFNNQSTIDYFIANNYFNYPKNKIHFFIQDKLPILDTNGKILLKDKSSILFGGNGNGNVFSSLKESKLLDHMITNKIKKVLFVSVDNVLSKLVDYPLIGYSINNNNKVVTKTLFKQENQKDWIFCLYKNKPSMLPGDYQNDYIINEKDENGNYLYRDTNITYHLIDIEEIIKYSSIKLPYHRAYKKNTYMNFDGNIIIPEQPNTFKFEQFIFDAFSYSDDMLLCRVDKTEFCPIKTEEDIKYASKELSKMEE